MHDSSTTHATHGTPQGTPAAGGPSGVRNGVSGGPAQPLPPSSNTGAQNTNATKHPIPTEPRRALLDYCALTLPDGFTPEQVQQLLGLNPHNVTELSKGVSGYRSGRSYGKTRVYWDGNAGMGIHVIATGEACRELETATGPVYWKLLDRQVQSLGGHFTRVDVAIDDYTGSLDLGVIEKQAKADLYRSRWKGGHIHEGFGAKSGKTIYFGSRQSNAFCRFYDKAEEQDVDFPWVRCELELKGSHADAVMGFIAHDIAIGEIVTGIITGYLTFVDESDDSNKSRWPASSWWTTWLGEVAPLRLSSAAPKTVSIEAMCENVEHQYGPTLATLRRALGPKGFHQWLGRVDTRGAARMKDHHHTALQLAAAA